MRLVAACAYLFTAGVLAAQPSPSPDDLYQRVRRRVLADIARLPNYTCVQTITRRVSGSAARGKRPTCAQIIKEHQAEKHNQPLLSWDRLRIDIAIADQREVYSWVGADRFEKDNMEELVGEGQTSTGDFGSLLLGIFSGHPSMRFQGERKAGPRRLFEYTYETPEKSSNYQIKVSWTRFTTAYEGSVFLDPETSDVVRVTARSAELPDQSGYCQTSKELEYAREHIGADVALIPKEARVAVISRDDVELFNASDYASCHEYVGESVLRFDDPDAVAAGAGSPHSDNKPDLQVAIPPGLPFDCRIVTPIDSDTAAMGDLIEAVLRSPISDTKGGVLAPAGTRIRGRLMRFAVRPGNAGQKEAYEIGVQFRWIVLGGARVPLAANLAGSSASKGAARLNLRPGVGLFVFNEKRVHVDSLDAKWITVAADDRRKASP